jgi:hypothetical protein
MTVQYRQNEIHLISTNSAKKDCTRLNIVLNRAFKIYCYSHFGIYVMVTSGISGRFCHDTRELVMIH